MIVGESEILGQVREAWQAAVREGTAPQLAGLFRHAVESGKRVRTETGISRHPVSIPSAAVTVAAEHLGTFDGAKVLVVGAGQMGTGLASTLRSRGVDHVWIANRTFERGAGSCRPHRRRGDTAERDCRHARGCRRVAVVHRVAAGAHRTLDDRDGHGVPRRAAVARRRRGAAPRRRSRRTRGQRRDVARSRRLEGLRAAVGRAAARGDRQGARDPRGRDRALPRRSLEPRGRAARGLPARARRACAHR